MEVAALGRRPGSGPGAPPGRSVGAALCSRGRPAVVRGPPPWAVPLGGEGAAVGSSRPRPRGARVAPPLSFFSASFSPSSSCSRSPSSLSPFSSFPPSSAPSPCLVGAGSPSGPGEAAASVVARGGRPACLDVAGAVGRRVGHTELGKEGRPPPPKPRPARSVLVTTEATVAWLPLDEGPIPVAMDTNEKGMPEDVQVEDPELMGAMSAEEAGDTVGLRGRPGGRGEAGGRESRDVSAVRTGEGALLVTPEGLDRKSVV